MQASLHTAHAMLPCTQVMELAEQLTAVCHERLQLSQKVRDPGPAIAASLEAASKRQQFLEQQVEDAQERTAATQAEKETGEAFRGVTQGSASEACCADAQTGPIHLTSPKLPAEAVDEFTHCQACASCLQQQLLCRPKDKPTVALLATIAKTA